MVGARVLRSARTGLTRFKMVKLDPKYAKLVAAVVAAVLAVVGIYFPDFSTVAGTIAGLLLGKELLPSTGSQDKVVP